MGTFLLILPLSELNAYIDNIIVLILVEGFRRGRPCSCQRSQCQDSPDCHQVL